MTIESFIQKIKQTPETVSFADTMDVVEANYVFEPTYFKNGETENQAGQNSGSCKLFAFAKKNALSKDETLACFGSYYREDVLKNPEGTDHQNIRNFMKTSWEGISFEKEPLFIK